MRRESFNFLLDVVKRESIGPDDFMIGNQIINPRIILQVSLYHFGCLKTYEEIGQVFNMSKTAVHKCVCKIMKIFNGISNQFIRWPKNVEADKFERNFKVNRISYLILISFNTFVH